MPTKQYLVETDKGKFMVDVDEPVNLQAQGGDTIRGEDPNAPSVMGRLQDALGHAAQPESVGDFLSLLIPSGASEAATGLKDMARIMRQATKESPSLRGILPKIVEIMRERPKTLQDFQSKGFNQLPLAQQMEHLPATPAPPGRSTAPASWDVMRPPETTPVAPAPTAPAPVASTAARRLTAEEQQAVKALVDQGYEEKDVLAQLDKMRSPSPAAPVTAKKGILNAAEMKEYLRLTRAGKKPTEAFELIQAQRDMVQRLGTPASEAVRQKVQARNASGRWED